MNAPEASEVTVRAKAGFARFVNSTVVNPWRFPPTNVRPSRVPEGYAVRLNPSRPIGPRERTAGRVARSPAVAVTLNSPGSNPRMLYPPFPSPRAVRVVPFVRSTKRTSASGTTSPEGCFTTPFTRRPVTGMSIVVSVTGMSWETEGIVRPAAVTFTYVVPRYMSWIVYRPAASATVVFSIPSSRFRTRTPAPAIGRSCPSSNAPFAFMSRYTRPVTVAPGRTMS